MCPVEMQYRPLKPANTDESIKCFIINFGDLPELVMCQMRVFLFYDNNDTADIGKLNSISMQHLRVPWDHYTVKRVFYAEDGSGSSQLAVSGCKLHLYEKILSYIRQSVSDGNMSAHCAVRTFSKYFDMSICMMISMIENGCFPGRRVIGSRLRVGTGLCL